jgi:hypothetical protein
VLILVHALFVANCGSAKYRLANIKYSYLAVIKDGFEIIGEAVVDALGGKFVYFGDVYIALRAPFRCFSSYVCGFLPPDIPSICVLFGND